MHTFMLLAIFLIELNFLISFLYKLIPQEKYDQTSPSQGKKKLQLVIKPYGFGFHISPLTF